MKREKGLSMYTVKYKKGSETDELAFDILIHVSILALVLTVFFWTVIQPIAKKAIDKELNNGIDKIFQSIVINMPEDSSIKSAACVALEELNTKYSNPDVATESKNKWLLGANIMAVCILFATLAGGWLTLFYSCKKKVSLGLLIGENILLFGIIGLVEAAFFIFAAQKFIPVPPSTMGTTFIKKMQDKLAKPDA
tara:strand:+ start:11361 stop:11945 length:585 start_codon:yes stop_codon:yes gene_type:complete